VGVEAGELVRTLKVIDELARGGGCHAQQKSNPGEGRVMVGAGGRWSSYALQCKETGPKCDQVLRVPAVHWSVNTTLSVLCRVLQGLQ
jgi:hypothetical protein